jgi:predicted transcriptional regulator
LKAVLEAGNGNQVKCKDKSKGEFYVYLENHFLILPDQKTVIGVDKDRISMIMEDITNSESGYSPVRFGKHEDTIYTLIFVEELSMLLVGDNAGKLTQYHYDSGNNSWSVVKEYGDLGIGQVISGIRIGHLVIFGGYESYSLRVVDSMKMEIQGDPFKTAIEVIYSISLGKVSESQVILYLSGWGGKYSETASDVLDITELMKEYKVSIGEGRKESVKKEKKVKKRREMVSDSEEEMIIGNCMCTSENILSKILVKVEHYMNSVIQEMMRDISKAGKGKGI